MLFPLTSKLQPIIHGVSSCARPATLIWDPAAERRLNSTSRLAPSSKRRVSVLNVAILLLSFWSTTFAAQSFDDYHNRVKQAVTALDTLSQADENETSEARQYRLTATLERVRTALPETETIDWDGTPATVDNKWLHTELAPVPEQSAPERAEVLAQVIQRLRAIDDRLLEVEKASARTFTKEEANAKLKAILARGEFVPQQREGNALQRLTKRFFQWFENLFPKRQMTPGNAGIISLIARWFVILLALAVIGYAVKMLMTRFVGPGKSFKKPKREARIVLGETLAPDQTAHDLLSEAEALARKGELRAAIRKGYIALLVELGERKVISLAQHKTNRDYLRSLRAVEPLYGNVKGLTDSFERHWYGFAGTTESDWAEFRTGYRNALR